MQRRPHSPCGLRRVIVNSDVFGEGIVKFSHQFERQRAPVSELKRIVRRFWRRK
jgi:hypothetical protein